MVVRISLVPYFLVIIVCYYPLLFVLHGYTGRAPSIRQYSGFDQIADQERFIVVYVQGTTDQFGNTGWNVDVVPSFLSVNDVGFFKALIKYFKAPYESSLIKLSNALLVRKILQNSSNILAFDILPSK